MTLQEKAFMCDLIKKTYRRRMFVYYLFVVAICSPIFVLIFWHNDLGHYEMYIASVGIILFIVATLYYNQSKYLSLMPWKLKKMQVEALEAYSKSDFEDLICSVPLQEYFRV